ncbi:MAG: hypothetical protein ABTD50_09340 [Polyangiaceae bacterium]|jgi:hypothetical protein
MEASGSRARARIVVWVVGLVGALTVPGCGTSSNGATEDASRDGAAGQPGSNEAASDGAESSDADSSTTSSATDAHRDAVGELGDAATDSPADATLDAALDTGTDASVDHALDSMVDAASADTAPVDDGGAVDSAAADGSSNDGSSNDGGPSVDAGAADGSASDADPCTPQGSGDIAVLGCPCVTPAALACAGNDQRVVLICSGGTWAFAQTCDRGQNCDSTPGANQASCATLDTACAGESPGYRYCGDSANVIECGPDLLNHTQVQTCPLPSCDAGACTNVCTPGQAQCVDATHIEACDPAGHWVETACPYACLSAPSGDGGVCGGACVPQAACSEPCTHGAPSPGTCDNGGDCIAAAMTDGGAACNAACSSDADCALGEFCWQNTCVNVAAVSAGGDHACALTTAGGVQCWGNNDVGQLGAGLSAPSSSLPVPVFGLSTGIAAISAGSAHTCVLTTAGGVVCWGLGTAGQLGNGASQSSSIPVAVAGMTSGASDLTCGDMVSCAYQAEWIRCWGATNQVDSSMSPSNVPSSEANVYMGSLSAGFVLCGSNTESIGCFDFTNFGPYNPTLFGWTDGSVSVGATQFCAVTADGGVDCYSKSNTFGEVGNGTTSPDPELAPVSGLSNAVTVSAGTDVTCATTTAGAVLCWGRNDQGQLGNNTTVNSSTPVPVSGLDSGAASVSVGSGYACAVTSAARAVCWGANRSGELGDGQDAGSLAPVDVVEP